jgi:uncharacterized protein (DUF1800 family)
VARTEARYNTHVAATPVYRGQFGAAQAERLLWRAGFGPRKGEAAALARKGLRGAVRSLTRPGGEHLVGPEPTDAQGRPLAPFDAAGHDHMWWLDRMVRTSRPLVERMALVWHDWFATQRVGGIPQKGIIDQNELFRRNALGSFAQLLEDVTKDPAMLRWLNGDKNTVRSPNENYAREMMELFTLGVNRGYTEQDIREQARALTGWRGIRRRAEGTYDFVYEPRLHDAGMKTVFGKSGAFAWQDACRLCLQHPNHPSFFVSKLWSYFVPTTPPRATQRALEALYRNGYQVRPVVEAILQHPALYTGPRLVKPPAVYAAGLLRATGGGVRGANWANLGATAGQRLFRPPNVAGWDDKRWLDTSTFRGRWLLAGAALQSTGSAATPRNAKALVDRAAAGLGIRSLTKPTRTAATRLAADALRSNAPDVAERAVRQLLALSPEVQTC